MRSLPLSMMLMDVFAGVLAVLMLVVALLLAILIAINAARGQGADNDQLMIMVGFFVLGATGFYALKRWVKRTVSPNPKTQKD